MTDGHFLTTEEVLDYLQVNLRTVYRLIKAGRIPAVRVGRQWRFRKADIEEWLIANQSGGKNAAVAARPRILVVDDEPQVRELLAKTLVSADYDVDTVPDGPAALDYLHSQPCDLLVTDLKMPGMDGLTLIREMRRKFRELPVIVITGFSTEASAIEALNLGVSGYLTKPFRIPRVLHAAARALGEPEPTVEV
jgi:excisionase family DNA binding protein